MGFLASQSIIVHIFNKMPNIPDKIYVDLWSLRELLF